MNSSYFYLPLEFFILLRYLASGDKNFVFCCAGEMSVHAPIFPHPFGGNDKLMRPLDIAFFGYLTADQLLGRHVGQRAGPAIGNLLLCGQPCEAEIGDPVPAGQHISR